MRPLEILVSRLPDGTVRTDAETLRERAIDSWALALLRRVRGDELPIPAAVIFPASTQEVATVLAWASQTSTAVIPRGGGSGVCGGAQAQTRSVVLDLSRMDQVTDIDLVSQVVHVEAGMRGDQLETALAEHGLTTGLYPQSIAISTVGGWIAASSAGQASAGGARYAAGFWLTLPGFRPAAVRLDADGHAFGWQAFNVVVANCRFYGGGMQISPKSDPGDGLLDVLVMTGPKSDAFTTLPKVYRGTHLPHRNIAELRAGRIGVDVDRPFPVEADGEMLGTTPASFGIIPSGVRLKV